MSERTKDDVIKSVYNARDGFGSVTTTFIKAKQKDKTITKQNVKDWFFKNVENKAPAKGYNSYINNAAHEEYQMDFIFFPGQDVGLAMIDTFSKFATVIAIPDKTQPNANSAVLEGITKMASVLGQTPKMIYCDPDANFETSPDMFKLLEERDIKLIITKSHASVVERFNRTFKNMISKRMEASKKKDVKWTDFLFDVLTTYNRLMVSAATGMTPNEARKKENTLQVKVNLEMQRHSTRKYPELQVGDKVKTLFKKTYGQKESVSNWNAEKPKIERISTSFGQKYYHLKDDPRSYLRHDLLKVA